MCCREGCEADNGIHRRADVVGHAGQKCTFRPARRLCLFRENAHLLRILQGGLLHFPYPHNQQNQENNKEDQNCNQHKHSARMELCQHQRRQILRFVSGIFCGDVFDRILRHCVNTFRQYACQRMVALTRDHDVVGIRRLIHKRIGQRPAQVPVHIFLRRIVINKGRIRFSFFDRLHCFFTVAAKQLLGVLHIIIFKTSGAPLIYRSYRFNRSVKITSCHPGDPHGHIRCRNAIVQGFHQILRGAPQIETQQCRVLLLLIHPLLSGIAHNQLIPESCLFCQLSEIIRNNALHLSVFCIGIRITGRIAHRRDRRFLCIICFDQCLLFLREFQIGIAAIPVTAIIQFRFPVSFRCIHLINCIVNRIQKFCVSFSDRYAKVAGIQVFNDLLSFQFAERNRNSCVNGIASQGISDLPNRITVDRLIVKSFQVGEIAEIPARRAAFQQGDPHSVIRGIIAFNDFCIVAFYCQNISA